MQQLLSPKKPMSEKTKTVLILCASIGALAAALVYIVPKNEKLGNLIVMVLAVIVGIFYTRYNAIRKKERQNKKK